MRWSTNIGMGLTLWAMVPGCGPSEGKGEDSALEGDGDAACAAPAMIAITGGTFTMGSPGDEVGRRWDEDQHEVTLNNAFEIGVTEVTQGLFDACMGYNPSYYSTCGADCPVEEVSWHQAAAFANAVSDAEALEQCYECSRSASGVKCDLRSRFATPYDCSGYRLPTEAEWEFAGRAGGEAAHSYGGNPVEGEGDSCNGDLELDNGSMLDDIAWYCGNSYDETHPVASLDANAWGLYDMSGNVSEWVGDWYDDYSTLSADDPFGASSGAGRVNRGGSWGNSYSSVRLAARGRGAPGEPSRGFGLRLTRSSP